MEESIQVLVGKVNQERWHPGRENWKLRQKVGSWPGCAQRAKARGWCSISEKKVSVWKRRGNPGCRMTFCNLWVGLNFSRAMERNLQGSKCGNGGAWKRGLPVGIAGKGWLLEKSEMKKHWDFSNHSSAKSQLIQWLGAWVPGRTALSPALIRKGCGKEETLWGKIKNWTKSNWPFTKMYQGFSLDSKGRIQILLRTQNLRDLPGWLCRALLHPWDPWSPEGELCGQRQVRTSGWSPVFLWVNGFPWAEPHCVLQVLRQ